MQYVIIGAGSRGMTYGLWAKEHGISIAAIAECRPDRLQFAGQELNVPENMRFSDASQLLAQGKTADAAIIATIFIIVFGFIVVRFIISGWFSPSPFER